MMNTRHSAAVTMLLAAAVVPVANADIIDVPGEQPTIQAGIDAAMNGDEVVVSVGEYFELINFNGKAITVRSTDPTDGDVVVDTIIDGGGSGSVVTCSSGEGPDTVLSGFVITGGVNSWNAPSNCPSLIRTIDSLNINSLASAQSAFTHNEIRGHCRPSYFAT